MSSSTSHHHRHGDTTGQKRARKILAFFLFLTVSLLSLSVCIRVSFVSKTAIINTMVSDTYVQGVASNALDYAHDLCDECSVAYDSVDGTVTFDAIYDIQRAYYNGILGASDKFNETAYKEYIENMGADLKSATLKMIDSQNLTVEGDREKTAALFSSKITDYVTEITELSFTEVLKTIVTVGGVASMIAMAGTFLLAVVLILIIVSIGKKLYRALRDVAFAFYAAAMLNLLLTGGVELVKRVKTLVLFPRYLSDAVMHYVDNCVASVGVSAVVLLVIALALTAVVWTMNRNENN